MTIRPVTGDDWPRIGELAELLVRVHHGWDQSRFIPPDALRGNDYASRVREELERTPATVHVADDDGRVIGFVFVGVEPGSWKELRPEAGYIHDVVVEDARRHLGIGRALVASAIQWLAGNGVARVMLWTAHENTIAQRLFHGFGFRRTMMEMTLDLNHEEQENHRDHKGHKEEDSSL